MVNPKTPNKKRKSLANEGETPVVSPKLAKLETSIQTPGKKGNASPGKQNKTPKQNNGKTPNKNVKTPKPTPLKNQPGSGKKNNQKKDSESENENSSPKKVKMFQGTADLQISPDKKAAKGPKNQAKKKTQSAQKRKGQFFHLKQKLEKGDKAALTEITAKIEALESRKEITKTAKRKLRLLQKLKATATGERKETPKVASISKKRRERRKDAKTKNEGGENKPQADQQKTAKGQKTSKQAADADDSSESDYEVESEIKPDKIIKTANAEEEDSDDDDDDAEEEESGDEEDDESGGEEEEDEDESEEEVPQLVKVQKGGKKKGDDKKSEVKAKNLKLQAMRKQGQLAGSVKENQKRSARRAKKNVKAVNGS